MPHFMKNPSVWIRVVPCGRTDRQRQTQTDNEANSRLRNFANVPKNAVLIYNVTN